MVTTDLGCPRCPVVHHACACAAQQHPRWAPRKSQKEGVSQGVGTTSSLASAGWLGVSKIEPVSISKLLGRCL